jgi:hypothetical protein
MKIKVSLPEGSITEKKKDFPSGEKAALNSDFGVETVPGAKTSGVVPGGFCPMYFSLKVRISLARNGSHRNVIIKSRKYAANSFSPIHISYKQVSSERLNFFIVTFAIE